MRWSAAARIALYGSDCHDRHVLALSSKNSATALSGAKALTRLAGSWLTPAATCFAVSPMACPQVRVVGAGGSSGVGGAAVGSYCGA